MKPPLNNLIVHGQQYYAITTLLYSIAFYFVCAGIGKLKTKYETNKTTN